MEAKFRAPDAVVIAQDERSELHVQPVIQSGQRHLDVRVWRRSSGDLAPSRTGLTLEARDLHLLQSGVAELLETSAGGHQAARVVWDGEDGRRLRAETEPFGTHYLARLGFWQRVRNTWKPADDGLVLLADSLQPLRAALDRFRAWLTLPDGGGPHGVFVPARSQSLDAWPASGADWLTIELDRVAFHPRGVRITCTVTEQDARHWLLIHQWRREDSIWVPEDVSLMLTITDLDAVLSRLAELLRSRDAHGGDASLARDLVTAGGSTLRIGVYQGEGQPMLRIERHASEETEFQPHVWLAAEYLPRFGRALAQGWFLLAGWLSHMERMELQGREEATRRAEESGEQEESSVQAPVDVVEIAVEEATPAAGGPEPPSSGKKPYHVYAFAAESRWPGTIISTETELQVVVERLPLREMIAMPLEVVPRIVVGLEHLHTLHGRQLQIDPILLCDRPDCAIYGLVSTAAGHDVCELCRRSDPNTSQSVSFEATSLPDLIDGLSRAAGLPDASAFPFTQAENGTEPPMPLPLRSSPAHLRRIAPSAPLCVPGPIVPGGTESSDRLDRPLGDLKLGRQRVSLSVHGHSEQPILTLTWEGNTLEVPAGRLEELLADIRELYYGALRGRRGRTLSVAEYPGVLVSIHSQGAGLHCLLRQEIDGEVISLSFPANQVPLFLNAARAALSTS